MNPVHTAGSGTGQDGRLSRSTPEKLFEKSLPGGLGWTAVSPDMKFVSFSSIRFVFKEIPHHDFGRVLMLFAPTGQYSTAQAEGLGS